MLRESVFSPEVLRQIDAIRETDIVIGIPTYNNSQTIGHVIRAVIAGIAKYFPEQRAIIVNSDGGSTDRTVEIVSTSTLDDPRMVMLSHSPDPIRKIIMPYQGFPGRAGAFRTIFQIAQSLDARVCATVDSSLKSITPEWIELLVKPILAEGFDCVTPLYMRHKYDGTITNSIVYPLTRSLYGRRVRQPIGGDFGFSNRLVSNYLSKDIWHANLVQHGMEVWMVTTAVAEGYRICQSFLGAKLQDSREASGDLSSILNRVIGTAFSLMETYENVWISVQGSEPCPIFGFPFDIGLEPVNVNVERMIGAFRQGVADLAVVWQRLLSPGTLDGLRKVSAAPTFHFPDSLWVRTVMDFAVAHFRRRMDRDHLNKSITPLYLGRTALFVLETQTSDAADVENRLELLSLEYENLKPYLMQLWRG